MAYEILSVKLCELEDRLARLCGRIHLSETAARPQLQQEIRALRRECDETELALRESLQHSRAEISNILADFYEKTERNLQDTKAVLQKQAFRHGGSETEAEEKTLLAEYALDFSLQAANRALLLALEAVDAHHTKRRGDDART